MIARALLSGVAALLRQREQRTLSPMCSGASCARMTRRILPSYAPIHCVVSEGS
jgi:hypothetical protein